MKLSFALCGTARANALSADNFAKAREIVAWKEKVAAAWNDIKVLEVKQEGDLSNPVTGDKFDATVVLDTNGLGDDVAVELVMFRVEDGQDKFEGSHNFKVVKKEGNIITYRLDTKIADAGVFRYGFRIYPSNPELPHRQDFAFTRWI